MNDRFKFRVWDKELKYFHDQPDYFLSSNGKLHTVTLNHRKEIDVIEIENSDNYVVQQCTGLKDSENFLIYEGDIISTCDDRNLELTVFWQQELSRFEASSPEYKGDNIICNIFVLTGRCAKICKIIGSIFEGIKNEN